MADKIAFEKIKGGARQMAAIEWADQDGAINIELSEENGRSDRTIKVRLEPDEIFRLLTFLSGK